MHNFPTQPHSQWDGVRESYSRITQKFSIFPTGNMNPSHATPAVRVSNGCKNYGKSVVFNGLEMTVKRGITYALLGSSGCGLVNFEHNLSSSNSIFLNFRIWSFQEDDAALQYRGYQAVDFRFRSNIWERRVQKWKDKYRIHATGIRSSCRAHNFRRASLFRKAVRDGVELRGGKNTFPRGSFTASWRKLFDSKFEVGKNAPCTWTI